MALAADDTIGDVTDSAPSQGFFEGDESYGARVALEAHEHASDERDSDSGE